MDVNQNKKKWKNLCLRVDPLLGKISFEIISTSDGHIPGFQASFYRTT